MRLEADRGKQHRLPTPFANGPGPKRGLLPRHPLWLVLLVGVLCLPSLWPKRTDRREVLASELVRKDSLLYLGEQTRPFTGFMVEKHSNGILKSRSAIREGALEGLSEGWFTNGQLQVREFFKGGISHGLREKWYENGVKSSEGAIAEGKHTGVFRRWHPNSALAEEVCMRDGVPDGISRAFYPSGFLQAEVKLRNGKVVDRQSWADHEMRIN